MREIKFRGKAKNGEWIYGDLLHSFQAKPPTSITEIVTIDQTDGWTDGSEVHPETVGQFTGLRDKNGTEIYEGDVVSASNHKGQVKWMSGKCCFQISPGGVFLSPKCQVLGNIHDNPELLNSNDTVAK